MKHDSNVTMKVLLGLGALGEDCLSVDYAQQERIVSRNRPL
jgi:hypothetical protein